MTIIAKWLSENQLKISKFLSMIRQWIAIIDYAGNLDNYIGTINFLIDEDYFPELDGGTTEYYYDTYTIIKCHNLDGNRDVYIGICLLYCNVLTIIFSLFAIIMLHFQILQEETYLANTFGEEYMTYKNRVFRYIGRR